MFSNFLFITSKEQYKSFAYSCLEAEKSIIVSPATCAILSRRALELAVKWVYSFDADLKVPYQTQLSTLIHDSNFLGIIDEKMLPLLKYIVKLGNAAVHTSTVISRDEAVLSLHNLHQFVSWIDYCYSEECTVEDFNEGALLQGEEKPVRPEELQDLYERLSAKDQKLEEMIKENQALRQKMAERRVNNAAENTFVVDDISEYETRKRYIDLDLKIAGWMFGKDIQIEYPVHGMPNNTGEGFVDYVLFGDNGKPLALVEAKRTSINPQQGQQQAKLYADCLQQKFGQRPVIFLSNGFETFIWDDLEYTTYRKVSGYYTKEELELFVERRTAKVPFDDIKINEKISNRYYQKEAIISVCREFERKRRKALLVMATGSGKTRTAISIVDILTRHNYVKNILFLADRKTLVYQAKNNFVNLLPSLTVCNLLDNKDNPENSRMVFSTYPTMMNAIDDAKRKNGNKLFTVGHFDLIIIDESHRSIYKKYQAIFEYFDSMLLGLTATPKTDIDKNTYGIFDLESGVPTYAYELDQAVNDGFLVDYNSIETTLKFIESGIKYDDLSEEEKAIYEETFDDEEGDNIGSEALNTWLFNDDTIDKVLQMLMERGIRVEGGDKLGKTILFAKNHNHAKAIMERFGKLFPDYPGSYARVIDYSVNYYQSLIDDFSTRQKLPQIAISVDMLDTGVDIPEVVNLVFFKKVRSKSKFWQMIGRGTRLCPDLLAIGEDKEKFLIFDYCGNFDFFRENPKGIEGGLMESLTEKIVKTQVDIIRELQDLRYQTEEYISHRAEMVESVCTMVQALNEENFRIRQQIKYVHHLKEKQAWLALSAVDVNDFKEKVAPLITPFSDDEMAKRFDYLMLTIELAQMQNKNAGKSIGRVKTTAEALSKLGTIPQVAAQKYIIEKVQCEEFWEDADIFEMEAVREALRDLIKFIEKTTQKIYYTNFTDEIIAVHENKAIYDINDLQNYKKKVNQYLKEHQNDLAIYKLRNNKQLTVDDLKTLEKVLWHDLGSQKDYQKIYGDTPISKLVRKITGLDRMAANQAFSQFLTSEKLNEKQIRFVKLIVDYIVANGVMEDRRVMMEDPFRTLGSITEIFSDMNDTSRLLSIIDEINRNCEFVVGA